VSHLICEKRCILNLTGELVPFYVNIVRKEAFVEHAICVFCFLGEMTRKESIKLREWVFHFERNVFLKKHGFFEFFTVYNEYNTAKNEK